MSHKNIRIEFVPKITMRYDTLGDFWETDSEIVIQIASELPEIEQYLVALHELVELKLCAYRGISNKAIDAFDLAYQGEGEPGDDPEAPYRKEHRFAMLIEHLTAHELGLAGYGHVE